MGRMKDLAIEEQERQLRFPDMDYTEEWDGLESLLFDGHNPTSFMEIQYQESLYKLMYNYHQLTNEEIEIINKLAKRIV